MTKNPIINALAAFVYIVLIVVLLNFATKLVGPGPEADQAFVMPIVMLSLFTLSAAVMGYLFCLQPVRLYLDGKKTEGVNLFVRTIGIFAVLTTVSVVVMLISLRQ